MTTPEPSPWLRGLLLLFLPVVAVAIHRDGQDYDPALLDFTRPMMVASSGAALPDTLLDLPRAGPPRLYTRANLYEYINGHAESYLAAGFKRLQVADYGSDLTVDLYDMGKPLHAFGILMEEVGEGTEPLPVGTMGFAHPQGMLFILGPYFVKVQTFREGMPLQRIGEALTRQWRIDPDRAGLAFAFPPVGKPLGDRFVKENYRGMSFLANVLERAVEIGGEKAHIALIQGAQPLTPGLTAFLEKEGIPHQREETPSGSVWRVEDPYEGAWRLLVSRERILGFFGPGAELALQEVLTHAKTPDP